MVSKYQRSAGARRYTDYDRAALKQCLAAIRAKTMSVAAASRKWNIPVRTLFRKLKEDVTSAKSPGHPTTFSVDEENAFAQHLLLLSEFDLPISVDDLKVCIRNYLEAQKRTVRYFKDNIPGRDWVRLFLQRHPNVSQRVAENVKLVRAGVNEETLRNYSAQLEKSLEGIPPSNIYNFDETNLCDNPGKRKVKDFFFLECYLPTSCLFLTYLPYVLGAL